MDDLRPVTVPGPAYPIAWTAASRQAQCKLPERAAPRPSSSSTAHWPRARAGPAQPLRLGLSGLHSARRGDYRVVYRANDGRHLVTVIAIEHRSDVYRPRRGE